MNIKRITYGGLAAALVMTVGELAIEPIMGSTIERFFTRLGLPMPGETASVILVLTLVALGWISVCLYAEFAIRSGSGAKTAAQTGALVWTLSCFLPNIVMYAYGIFDAGFFWFASAWPLVETVVATVIGAAVHDAGTIRRSSRVQVGP
jgi:hypothetical protein